MRQNRKQKTLDAAVDTLQHIHNAAGALLNDSLDDLRRLERTEAHRIGVTYSLHPRLVRKFECILGRKLVDAADLQDVRDVRHFTGALLELFRRVAR